jgi:osmoprotectant transport system substrate-binding protein
MFALVLAAVAVLVGACSPAAPSGPKPKIIMGSANFPEQVVLGELYAQALEANGYTVDRKLNLGNREITAPALEKGDINIYPEYLATYLTFVTKDPNLASSDPATTHKALEAALKDKNIAVLDSAPAQDQNAFVVTKATADKYGLKNISDLTKANGQLTLGGPPECPTRPFCAQGLQSTYGVNFKEVKQLDPGGPLTVQALKGGQVDVGLLFSSDAIIAVEGFVTLNDDKGLQRSDNIAPVVRLDVLNQAPDMRNVLNSVSSKLTTSELVGLNKQVGVDKKDAKDVAGAWLKQMGIKK